MSKIIGIDLGTTNSVVSVFEAGDTQIIKNSEGERKTPSVVKYEEDGGVIVGKQALNQSVMNPDRTIKSIKRHMGENYNVNINGKEYTPEQVSSEILRKLKEDAEEYIGEEVEKAVITVPAYFSDAGRQATKDAGEIAGLEVSRLLPEPTAAAISYGYNKNKDNNILVYDLGGGTFDVSILSSGGGVFEVNTTNGDKDLGGDDWTLKLINYVANKIKEEHDYNIKEDEEQYSRLKEACEESKKDLSSKKETTIRVPYVPVGDNSINIEEKITRSKFKDLTKDLLEKTKEPLKQAIEDSEVNINDIDDIILVGGSTRMPQVKELIEKEFNIKPKKDIDPDEAVARGAAIQSGVLDKDSEAGDLVVLDTIPLSLGIDTEDGFDKLIAKDTTIPTEIKKVYTTAKDNQRSISTLVAQGERPITEKNKILGKFDMRGIPPLPAGKPEIEVTFKVDENGIITLKAELIKPDKNVDNKVKIEGGTGLSDDEIEKLKKEAEENREKDKERKKNIESKNEADRLINNIEKDIKEYKQDLKEEHINKLNKLKEKLITEKQKIEKDEDYNYKDLNELINKTEKEKVDIFNQIY